MNFSHGLDVAKIAPKKAAAARDHRQEYDISAIFATPNRGKPRRMKQLRVSWPTLVTCTSHVAKRFFSKHNGHVICKAVKHGFTQHENMVTVATTQRIDSTFFDHFDDYAVTPMIYQREISKAFDVRVIVVCDEVFATAIHSQKYKQTEVDWRVWDAVDFDLYHEPIRLPDTIADRCRRMTRHFGLKYSAIDLARDRDGNYYFFEMNPNGQWAWIERKTGVRIRDALIRSMGVF